MRIPLLRVCCFLGVLVFSNVLSAQPPRRDPPGALPQDPFRAITNNIFAQAELMRSQGNLAVDLAEARKASAEAVSLELDNWKKYVRTYWETKRTRERERLKLERILDVRKLRYHNDERARNNKQWARIRDSLGFNGPPTDGKAMNFLLARLSVTLLAYDFTGENAKLDPSVAAELKISDKLLHAIKLRQSGAGGGQVVFRADSDAGLDLAHWPFLLRGKEFAVHRSKLEAIRAEVIREIEKDGKISTPSLKKLDGAIMATAQEFYRRNDAQTWARQGMMRYSQYRAAEAFLRRLDREMAAIQTKGDLRALAGLVKFDPKTDGQNVIGLLTHMARNGLEFAPADPNDGPAYHQLFSMMRSLYLIVAASDQGLQSKDLTKELER